jgi:flagellar basal body-associated protein FliL
MRKKLFQISIGIIVVALLATVTLLPFIFGRNPGTGTHAVDGKDEGRSSTFYTVTPEVTASKTVSVTPTMKSITPISTNDLPSPTSTEVLYTGKAALGTFQYGGLV